MQLWQPSHPSTPTRWVNMKGFTCITLGPLYCCQKRVFSLPFYLQSCFKEASGTILPNKNLCTGEGCDSPELRCCLPERCPAAGTCAAAAPGRHASPHTRGMERPNSGSILRAPKLHLTSIPARCGGSRSAQPSAGGVGSLRCVAMTLFALRRAAHGSIWLCVWFVCLF